MSESAKKRKCNTKGKKKIHKNNIQKFVNTSNLQKYFDDGWELCLPKNKLT